MTIFAAMKEESYNVDFRDSKTQSNRVVQSWTKANKAEQSRTKANRAEQYHYITHRNFEVNKWYLFECFNNYV